MLVERARHAHDEGVGHQLHEPARLAADAERRARDGVRRRVERLARPAAGRRAGARLGRRDLDLLAEHDADRRGGRGDHLVGRLGDGRQLQLGRARWRRPSRLRHAPSRPRSGARRRGVIRNTLRARDAVDVGDGDGDGGASSKLANGLWSSGSRPTRRRARPARGRSRRAPSRPPPRSRRRGASARRSARQCTAAPPPDPTIWTARREPLRPGWARWIGTSSAYTTTPSAASAPSRTRSPGANASTSSIASSTSATSARSVTSAPARARRHRRGDARVVGSRARRRGRPISSATGSIADHGISSASVEEWRLMRDLERERQRRLADGGDLQALRRASRRRCALERLAGEVLPLDRQLRRERVEQAAA